VKYLLLLLCSAALLGCSKGPAQVRVQNLTGRALTEVTIEETHFGSVAEGAFSAPREVPALNHDPTILTTDAKGDIRNRRVFHDPKGPVGTGKFIVALTFDPQGGLHAQVTRDDWLKIFSR
jgi:hypothetical protein